MDTGWIINNIGAIIGGFVVIAVAYFLFRKTSDKNQSENTSKDITSKEGGKNEAEKSISSPAESVSEKQTSPVWKTRRYVLNKIRSLKKPDILSGKQHEDIAKTIDSEDERLSSTVNLPIVDQYKDSPENHEENLENNPLIEEPSEDTSEISLPVTTDDTNSVSSEIEKTNVNGSIDNSDSSRIDMSTIPQADEIEVDNTQLEADVTKSEQPSEKPEGSSNVFDLFTDVDEEESDISKFASNLDQVDINNLLKEAKNIQKFTRR